MIHSQLYKCWIPLTVAWLFVCAAHGEQPTSSAAIDFNRQIRPILAQKCLACHGPDAEQRQAGLRLDLRDAATAALESGKTAIVPGNPVESELVRRIRATDADELMPPPDSRKKLSTAECDLLERWIVGGAEYAQHWSYVPPTRHAAPAVKDAAWPLNWIDSFLLTSLEAVGRRPSPDADRVTLLRRLSFDLTGLPPTPAEVDAFIQDSTTEAYERVVDRLLASPAYAERMAMYWLDLVRYADTVGYHGDQEHHASPYRDYVIHAFLTNLPHDRFTIEQLAGDLLPQPSTDQLIATAYNRLLQTSHEGGVQPKEYLAIYAADRVRNVSAVWLGATVGCAQCHDHKFDPYTMTDFYSLASFFADVDEADHLRRGKDVSPTVREPEIEVLSPLDRAPMAKPRRVMITKAIEPRTMRVLPRGNWLDDSGPEVRPAVPAFLGQLQIEGRRANRLDLAQWLVSPVAAGGVGELTARVQMNRLWYLLFGSGISRRLDDLGVQGEPPAHAELLDNLAVEFLESGWNWKHMVKLLVMSRAYRQSSLESPELRESDPYNRLVGRQTRFRLLAEMIRDGQLAISGLLVQELGGPSVRPYQPAGYYQHLNFPLRTYEADSDRRQWRRGLYMHWQRMFLHPQLLAFDAPSREECTAERAVSNTPKAALTLLNDPTFVEAARVFAEQVLHETADGDAARIRLAWRRALSREPESRETAALEQLLIQHREHYRAHPEAASELVRTGSSPPSTDLDVAEHAAWTSVMRAILNLNETITRE